MINYKELTTDFLSLRENGTLPSSNKPCPKGGYKFIAAFMRIFPEKNEKFAEQQLVCFETDLKQQTENMPLPTDPTSIKSWDRWYRTAPPSTINNLFFYLKNIAIDPKRQSPGERGLKKVLDGNFPKVFHKGND